MFMDKRKEIILNTIIKEHVKTGAPVGSGILVKKYKLDISPATVRNEMSALEEEGYIIQPHTSADRIPTELAYKFYIENLGNRKLNESVSRSIDDTFDRDNEQSFREVAKALADISGGAVFWAFHKHNLYYTGISNLFQQPEFKQLDLIYDISAIIDRFDEIVDEIFEDMNVGENVLVGEDNPFGAFCGTIIGKYKHEDKTGLFGMLGPMRMNYEKNLSIVNYILDKINENR